MPGVLELCDFDIYKASDTISHNNSALKERVKHSGFKVVRQQAPTTMPDSLSIITGSYMVEGENRLLQAVLYLANVFHGMHMCAHAHTQTYTHK